MTSNLGSEYLLEHNDNANEMVMKEVQSHFRPEFLNRIDEIVMFNPLSRDVQIKIVSKLLNELKLRLEKNNIHVEFSNRVNSFIIENSYNTNYGARPIKRFIQKNIETEIAKKIISSEIEPQASYLIDFDGKLIVKKK